MDQYTLARKVHELSAGDVAVAREFTRILTDTNRAALATLREALHAGAWSEAASAAHRINGSARLIGFRRLVEQTVQMESAAAAGDATRAATLIGSVEDDVERLDTWLASLHNADGPQD